MQFFYRLSFYILLLALAACHKGAPVTNEPPPVTTPPVVATPTLPDNKLWRQAHTDTYGTNTDIQFVSADTGFVFGYNNTGSYLLRTVDGGENWNMLKQFDASNPRFSAFYPINSTNIIIARTGIYLSKDGGKSFNSIQNTPNTFTAGRFYFSDTNNGIELTGDNVFKTSDYNTWLKVYISTNGTGYSMMCFPDKNTGYIAGGHVVEANASNIVTTYGVLAKTTDGGNTWTELYSGNWLQNTQSFHQIYGLSFVDTQNGYMVTEGQRLLKTSDGGLNWVPINNSFPAFIGSALLFTSLSTGYFVNGSRVYATYNGGLNYNWEYNFTDDLYQIAAGKAGNKKIFIVGRNGAILIRDN